MGYRIQLNAVDRGRLTNILKFTEHAIDNYSTQFTGEDIALIQKLRKALEDKNEYFIILDE